MNVVIFCGGKGTRLREETEFRPKMMVEIGDKPILWHIMRHYTRHNMHDFILCLGYKGDMIRRWILDYSNMSTDVRVDVAAQRTEQLLPVADGARWRVTLAETGLETPTGGRLLKVWRYVGNETFMCT